MSIPNIVLLILLASMKRCSIDGCVGMVVGRGWCCKHWTRWRKYGNPLALRPQGYKRDGARNPKWRGGEVNDGHGRILIYSPGHPNPSYCGTHVYRYRLVMEKHLGRYLLTSEIVHHKNGDVSDDRVENLVVTTQSEHAKAHNINGKFSKHAKEIV